MGYLHCFYVFMTALFAALLMVPALRKWAIDNDSFDVPDERKVHVGKVPRLGGVAIFLAFLFAILIYSDVGPQVRGVLAGGLVMFVVGLVDDLYGISPKAKFGGQIVACLLAMQVGGFCLLNLGDLFGFGVIELPYLVAVPFTVFAAIGVINAINLIDGLDGMAGGVSVIALATFFLLGYQDHNQQVMYLSAAMLGGILGFLKYNSYPAQIFMGDVGSLVVGFVLAFVAIGMTQGEGRSIQPVVPLLVLGLPILDTLLVMVKRVLKGGSPFLPDKTHVHHKFLTLGLQHRFTVLIIYGISIFWALFALLLGDRSQPFLLGVFLGISGLSYWVLRLLVRKRERFVFFSRDSAHGFRSSLLFARLGSLADAAALASRWLFLGYVLLAAGTGVLSGGELGKIILVTLVAGLALALFTGDTQNHFFHVYLYLAVLILVFLTDRASGMVLAGGLTVGRLEATILATLAALVFFKILFRQPEEVILSTPLDFLILGMSVSLALVSPQLELSQSLSLISAKGIVLFLALKVISNQARGFNRTMCGALLGSLMVLLCRGYVLI